MTTINFLKREPEVRSFDAGQPIFSEGQAGDVMYAVTEGEVHIVRGDRMLETVGEGGIFGELALLDDQPRSASAIAGPGEILVTSTLRDLVAGSGIDFEDAGSHELKGIAGSWQLFAVAA